ncbi:hypothetical protein [Cognatishimia activa]|uniref:Translocase n=1 Tax=Cognatishimia activa TaxID=1715691 RepID=A0A0P1ILY6_9RHOB|nr:hypothetical protein [Cognatishimia activa]CUI43512.1 hypothetical protein TA5113_00477 [Cognatishimia activa]CUK24629.1 hypothetical protein TA5114_00414 [Cognatishimia activa]
MIPIKLSGRSGKLALIAGTTVTAAAIGFFLQSGTPTQASAVQPEKVKKLEVPTEASVQIASSVGLSAHALPKVPSEPEASFPTRPITVSLSTDAPIAKMPLEEPTPILGCDMSLSAEPTIAALVDLTIEASCMPNARISISHAGLKFHEVLDDAGRLDITVPAFDEFASFNVTFPNGDERKARTEVPAVVFYDRVALQWLGETGLQIHALEFDADYGEEGHVWFGNPRDLTAVIGGNGGFMMRMGAGESEISRMADVYTFPKSNPSQDGQVLLTVEAEVNGANCNRPIAAETLQVNGGGDKLTNSFDLVMPDCGATGDFLVLKNLLEDLTIARNN